MENELLNNEADIDESFLIEIICKANLPSERLLLNLLSKDKVLKDDSGLFYQGVCFLKCLYHYDPWLDVPANYLIKDWDCGISISGKYCQMQREYPAYFAYLLGHELGHAHICCSDKWLHIHCCLVDSYLPKFFNKVQPYEYPDEKRFDRFGIFIAEQIFSRKMLNAEIKNLMKKTECNDRERLTSMLTLPSTNNLENIRSELIELTKPFKNELIISWEKDKESGLLAQEIKDFELLFKNS